MELEFNGSVILQSGKKCDLYNPNGFVFFNCLSKSMGDTEIWLKTMILHIIKINEKDLTISDIDNLSYDDACEITELITPFITKLNINI